MRLNFIWFILFLCLLSSTGLCILYLVARSVTH